MADAIRHPAEGGEDEWVLNGQKMWASNAGEADIYCVLYTTDPELGEERIALIYVLVDTKGLSFGPDENKAGMQGDSAPCTLITYGYPGNGGAKLGRFDVCRGYYDYRL